MILFQRRLTGFNVLGAREPLSCNHSKEDIDDACQAYSLDLSHAPNVIKHTHKGWVSERLEA